MVEISNVNLPSTLKEQCGVTEQSNVTEIDKVSEINDVAEQNKVTEQRKVTKQNNATEKDNVTEINDVTKLTNSGVIEINNVTEQSDVTEQSNVTEQTSVSEQSDVTEINNVTDIHDVTEQNNVTEQSSVTEQISVTEIENIIEQNDMTEQSDVTENKKVTVIDNVKKQSDVTIDIPDVIKVNKHDHTEKSGFTHIHYTEEYNTCQKDAVSVYTYLCYYCLWGAEERTDIMTHMFQKHPNERYTVQVRVCDAKSGLSFYKTKQFRLMCKSLQVHTSDKHTVNNCSPVGENFDPGHLQTNGTENNNLRSHDRLSKDDEKYDNSTVQEKNIGRVPVVQNRDSPGMDSPDADSLDSTGIPGDQNIAESECDLPANHQDMPSPAPANSQFMS